jgi:predicted secreted acid phosphatase
MKTYIVDIDGTLADLGHRLHFIQQEPKQWDAFFEACSEDTPINGVIFVIKALLHDGAYIVFLTGRPEKVRAKTVTWLNEQGLPVNHLIMRRDGDHREDTVAKLELLRSLPTGAEIAGIFEDRPSVCRTWRSMGLAVFQVGSGEEF